MAGIGDIVGQIIWTIITESLKVVLNLLKLFYQLIKAISPLSASGPGGFLLTAFILGGMAYFIAKYIFHIGKNSIALLVFGLIIFIAITTSMI